MRTRNPNITGKSGILGVEFSLGFPYIVRVGEDAVGLTYFSSKKKLELNPVKEYNLDIAKARLRPYSVNP